MKNLSTRLTRWIDLHQPSESVVMGAAAALVGLGSGVGVWLFKAAIEIVRGAAFGGIGQWLLPLGAWTVVLLPVTGGLLVGLLREKLIGEERHHGVAGIIEAVALGGGRLRYRRLPAKAVAAAISIGSGGSVGPEDPSVQIGANLGSLSGQVLKLSDDRVRSLVAAGAAGGVAAAFNAPIAGVFFALEIILGEISGSAFGAVLLAAVISAVFTQAVSGAQPAFDIPAYSFKSVGELPFYLGLGALAGPISAAYVFLIYRLHDSMHAIRLPEWLKPALAGLAVGLAGIFLPQVFGVGYETIGRILQGQEGLWSLLIVLMLAKLVLTPLSLAGGFQGGTFAPALFIGACLGGGYGLLLDKVFPDLGIVPPAFAMVGMAAVLAGAVHAPLTAIVLLFEMTHDYRIILPLMLAVGAGLFVSQRIQRDSVYALGLARKGIRLQRGRDVEVLEAIAVAEIMQAAPPTVRVSEPVQAALEVMTSQRRHGLPVVDGNGDLAGVISLQDIDRAGADAQGLARSVGEICTREVVTVFPDESIGAAVRRMGPRDLGRLPVVARNDPRKLVGLLRRSDLVRAYDLALARRAETRQRAQGVRLGALSGAQVEEFAVRDGAPCAGKRVKDVAWPRDCVLAAIRRGPALILPHGDTRLQAGDTLTIVVETEARAALQALCSG